MRSCRPKTCLKLKRVNLWAIQDAFTPTLLCYRVIGVLRTVRTLGGDRVLQHRSGTPCEAE